MLYVTRVYNNLLFVCLSEKLYVSLLHDKYLYVSKSHPHETTRVHHDIYICKTTRVFATKSLIVPTDDSST